MAEVSEDYRPGQVALFGAVLALVGGWTAPTWMGEWMGGSTDNVALGALLDEFTSPIPLTAVQTERVEDRDFAYRLDLSTDWDDVCSDALYRLDADLSPMYGGGVMTARLTPEAGAPNPNFQADIEVGVYKTGADTSEYDNPASQYLGALSVACDGVELNEPNRLEFDGVGVSRHEFGTVTKTHAGDYQQFFSAYGVPGYIITVYGGNASLDQVRQLSAAQAEQLEQLRRGGGDGAGGAGGAGAGGAGSIGMDQRGLVEWVRDLREP